MAGGYAAWTQNGLPTELWSVSVGTVAVNRISFGRSPMHANAEALHQDSDNLILEHVNAERAGGQSPRFLMQT